MEYSKEESWPYDDIEEFIPVLDHKCNCVESETNYIERMRQVLPHVLDEVMRE